MFFASHFASMLRPNAVRLRLLCDLSVPHIYKPEPVKQLSKAECADKRQKAERIFYQLPSLLSIHQS